MLDYEGLLIARAPISDGAKVTLLELAFHAKPPSLSDLAKKRNIARSTVHLHLSELRRRGYITVASQNGQKLLYKIHFDKLKREVGFVEKQSNAFIERGKSFMDSQVAKGLSKDFGTMECKDLLSLFRERYREHFGHVYTSNSKDYVYLMQLHKRYGAMKVCAMIDYFSHNWKRMGASCLDIQRLFDSSEKIAGRVTI